MTPEIFVPKVILILSSGILLCQIFIIFVLLGHLFKLNNKAPVYKFFAKLQSNWLAFAFSVALLATMGSLFLSEIAGFTPCKLCWWQRIFMYPQAIILAIALWRKDFQAYKYSFALSSIGALIAAYHYRLTLLPISTSFGFCLAGSESCASNNFMSFGYINIPLMSLTSFLLIILFLFIGRDSRKNQIN